MLAVHGVIEPARLNGEYTVVGTTNGKPKFSKVGEPGCTIIYAVVYGWPCWYIRTDHEHFSARTTKGSRVPPESGWSTILPGGIPLTYPGIGGIRISPVNGTSPLHDSPIAEDAAVDCQDSSVNEPEVKVRMWRSADSNSPNSSLIGDVTSLANLESQLEPVSGETAIRASS